MIVPHQRLTPETLDALLEEYVTRDGTELTDAAEKVAAARRAIEAGELVVVWDDESESCSVLAPEDAVAATDRPEPSE